MRRGPVRAPTEKRAARAVRLPARPSSAFATTEAQDGRASPVTHTPDGPSPHRQTRYATRANAARSARVPEATAATTLGRAHTRRAAAEVRA